MEWVETTASTVDEAVEQALDLLGVDRDDAEVQIVSEPKMGLFGKLREEARVRARVRPQAPRPKDASERARRPRREAAPQAARDPGEPREPREREPREPETHEPGESAGHVVPIEDQVARATEFLQGLLAAFDVAGAVEGTVVDEDTGELHITGDDLGVLIGAKGATLMAIQDLLRTVVQRKMAARNGRLYLDVGGYRAKRKVALRSFSAQVADEVRASGRAAALEPMNAADRKIVHDAINAIDGVTTRSEGEDPRRRVVISPG